MTEITGYLLLPSVAERTANEIDDLIMWHQLNMHAIAIGPLFIRSWTSRNYTGSLLH